MKLREEIFIRPPNCGTREASTSAHRTVSPYFLVVAGPSASARRLRLCFLKLPSFCSTEFRQPSSVGVLRRPSEETQFRCKAIDVTEWNSVSEPCNGLQSHVRQQLRIASLWPWFCSPEWTEWAVGWLPSRRRG